jgi:hypothetical protein
VRKFGTNALDRPWSQFHPDEPPIELPIYQGQIDPATWSQALRGTPEMPAAR